MSRWGQKIVIFRIGADAPPEISAPKQNCHPKACRSNRQGYPPLTFIVLTSTSTPPGAS